MAPEGQVRALLLAGAVGGALRIVAAFIPYTPESAALEALYAAVDVGMMLGLIGVHLRTAAHTGVAGFVFFVLALAALASIVGPDPQMFGIDFYRVGASAFALALAGYAFALILARVQAPAAMLWISCALFGVIASSTGSARAFLAAGVALGLGFIAAWVMPKFPSRKIENGEGA